MPPHVASSGHIDLVARALDDNDMLNTGCLGNGIICDAMLRTDAPDIYAAGDCCSFPHQLFDHQRMRLEAWRNASDQAHVATENMLGGEKAYMAVPWFCSDQYDLSLQIAGVPGDGVDTVRPQISLVL